MSAQARRTPDAEAVRAGSSVLSYAELEARANRLAHRLAGLGAGPGTVVGLCLERSEVLVTAMLAILKSGAAFVPVDPDYPADRRLYMLSDSGARLVVTSRALAGVLPAEVTAVVLDAAEEQAGDATDDAAASAPPAVAIGLEDLAYVIYTSGSTGRPKGVMIPHRGRAEFVSGLCGQ